eukprot:TRINITY_DN3064_c0_g1_i1.p1 TRINITY_DN3064_c0_g1~~TRINITY_DN3064_c0_g1_i1.p1  ORF type:complete len:286 (+),score=82.27 TRINITY_DN3064_c0_g1_i1:49-906(+)
MDLSLTSSEATKRRELVDALQELKDSDIVQAVLRILSWRENFLLTFLCFVIFNLIFILLYFFEYSVVTLFSYLFLSVLTASVVRYNWKTIMLMVSKKEDGEVPLSTAGPSSRFKQPRRRIDREVIEPLIEHIIFLLNYSHNHMRNVFLSRNTAASLKVCAVVWLFSIVGQIFSGLVLLYIVGLVFFIFPSLYETRKEQIDALIELMVERVATIVNSLESNIVHFVEKRTGIEIDEEAQELQREKEKQEKKERKAREKEQKEREQKEKEQREKEQKDTKLNSSRKK